LSLSVTPELSAKAAAGDVTDAEFTDCVAASLPYPWKIVSGLAGSLGDAEFARDSSVPADDQEWGQLFRFFASDSIRAAAERHFGVRLAFQNCCTVAAFRPGADEALARFTSPRAQLLNQSPELQNC